MERGIPSRGISIQNRTIHHKEHEGMKSLWKTPNPLHAFMFFMVKNYSLFASIHNDET